MWSKRITNSKRNLHLEKALIFYYYIFKKSSIALRQSYFELLVSEKSLIVKK